MPRQKLTATSSLNQDRISSRAAGAPARPAVQTAMYDEEPPPGWRHPRWHEPKGGFVRIEQPVDTTESASAPEASDWFAFSCSGPRQRGPAAEQDEEGWNVFDWICGKPPSRRPPITDDDEPEGELPSGVEEKFIAAASRIKKWRPKTPPSDEEKLKLYALFKQGNEGRATGEPPNIFDVVARAKYDSWKALGGMARGRAKLAYVMEVERQMSRE